MSESDNDRNQGEQEAPQQGVPDTESKNSLLWRQVNLGEEDGQSVPRSAKLAAGGLMLALLGLWGYYSWQHNLADNASSSGDGDEPVGVSEPEPTVLERLESSPPSAGNPEDSKPTYPQSNPGAPGSSSGNPSQSPFGTGSDPNAPSGNDKAQDESTPTLSEEGKPTSKPTEEDNSPSSPTEDDKPTSPAESRMLAPRARYPEEDARSSIQGEQPSERSPGDEERKQGSDDKEPGSDGPVVYSRPTPYGRGSTRPERNSTSPETPRTQTSANNQTRPEGQFPWWQRSVTSENGPQRYEAGGSKVTPGEDGDGGKFVYGPSPYMGQGRTGAADSPYHSGPYRAQDKGDGDEKSREILTLSPMIAIEQEQLIAELEASNEALRRLQEKVGDIDEKVSNLSSWPTLDGEESDRLAKDASKLDTELHATEEHLKLLGKDMQEYSPQNPEKP